MRQFQKRLKSWWSWLVSDFKSGIYRGSNHLSATLRQAIERLPIKQLVGVNLAGLAFFSVVVLPGASETLSSLEVLKDTQVTVVQTFPTEGEFQWPMERFGISQRFSVYHPGVDLTAAYGTPVYPVANGWVAWTNLSLWGYGNHVLVQHDKNIGSLYAHLSEINVQPGQAVTRKTEIGKVGTTGWTTGSHLHLEMYQDGSPINPFEVLPDLNLK